VKVAIRADASSRIGSGHVMRCKTLADELRRRGADVRFVCREQPGNLIHVLSAAGYRVAVLPPLADVDQSVDAEETIAALEGFAPDWLSVDHYGLDEEWESWVRHHADRLFVIDDLANRRHACDALLDQNHLDDETPHRYRGLVPEQCHCVFGPGYALLQPLFWQLRRSLSPRDGFVRRLLVFFGAVDSRKQTVKVLQGLQASEFADVAIDVVVGHANSDAPEIERLVIARPGATLYRELPSLAGLMARADMMLGAGGTTTWERCCLGLPSIVAITAANQERFTTAVAAMGAQYSLGQAATLSASDWVTALREFRGSPERVRACAAAARLMTDGLGVYRVVTTLQPARSAQVAARHAGRRAAAIGEDGDS
jgi:UDP-2,4-diacetamido-2,4,6-trideoxy-beta-L-altropyranose hydrolase